MKKLMGILGVMGSWAGLAFSVQALPAQYQPQWGFEVREEGLVAPAGNGTEVVIYESMGPADPILAELKATNEIFLLNPPVLDRCGDLHYWGTSGSVMEKKELGEWDLRFVPQNKKMNVFCQVAPLSRCLRPSETAPIDVGNYVSNQLSSSRATCLVQIWDGADLATSYQIISAKRVPQVI